MENANKTFKDQSIIPFLEKYTSQDARRLKDALRYAEFLTEEVFIKSGLGIEIDDIVRFEIDDCTREGNQKVKSIIQYSVEAYDNLQHVMKRCDIDVQFNKPE